MPAVGASADWLSNDLLAVGDLAGVWLERGLCMTDLKSGVPTPVPNDDTKEETVVKVMIGVDPHKGSHTAVDIDRDEAELAKSKVRASRRQVDELLTWATPFEQRTWAIESAGGLGFLLSEQLVAAGEHVVDVPATLAARVRLLGTGRSNKNDPNDARSVAIAALRAPQLAAVNRAEVGGVLRLLAKRNHDLGRSRNRTACRLHNNNRPALMRVQAVRDVLRHHMERVTGIEPAPPAWKAGHGGFRDLRVCDETPL